jgi:hypothetical protein
VIRTSLLTAGLWLGFCPSLAGANFTINLLVRAAGRQQSTASGQPGGARPRLAAKVGDILLVQWSAANPDTASALSDVTLHVFMERGSALLREETPKPSANAVYESAVVLDFEPGAKSSGEFRLPLSESGDYLLRVETIGASKKLGRESFAAIEVSVP